MCGSAAGAGRWGPVAPARRSRTSTLPRAPYGAWYRTGLHQDGTRITWTLGLIRDKGKIAKGGIGGSAAWWSLRHGHACAYLTRRLDDHARAAQIAIALGDDLTVVGED